MGSPYREPGDVRSWRGAWLEPLGRVEVGERLHVGAQFVVDAGRSREHGDLVIKRHARSGPGTAWLSHGSGVETSIWGGSTDRGELTRLCGRTGEAGELELEAFANQLLVLEGEAIRRSRGAWNHEVVCVGAWGGFSDEKPWREGTRWPAFQTALVTRRQPGVPLSSLDRFEARDLFVRMLPALWTALEAAPHGDLSLANLVIDRDIGRFALIDPGVVMRRYSRGPEGGAGGWMNHDCIFTTNAHAYPMLPPTWDMRGLPWRTQLDVFARLSWLLEGPLFVPENMHDIARFTGLSDLRDHVPPAGPRPRTSDIIAMGILYDCLLADGHPVYVDAPAVPLWSGAFGELGRPPIGEWVQRGAPLVFARERARGIPPAASALAERLVRCEIESRAELAALVAAV